jgi:hypothetical protein
MSVGMMFLVEFNGTVDYSKIETFIKKYFKVKLIKNAKEGWTLPKHQWALMFDKDKNDVVLSVNDLEDSKEWNLKTQADMKHILKTILDKYPDKVKRAIMMYEGDKEATVLYTKVS